MKEKRNLGFTLIELIAVLLILSAIGLITMPIINNSVENSREKALETSIKNLERAALLYVTENVYGKNTSYKYLSFDELRTKGYIENKDVINPTTNEELTGCIGYKWDTDNNQYKIEYSEECEFQVAYEVGNLLKVEVGNNEIHNFYVLKDNGDTLTLIMDRNIGDNIEWLTEEDLMEYVIDNNIDESSISSDEEFEEFLESIGPLTANNYMNDLTKDWKNAIEKRIPKATDILEHSDLYNSLSETEKANWETEYYGLFESLMSNSSILNKLGDPTNSGFRKALKNTEYEGLFLPEWLDINLMTSGADIDDSIATAKLGYWINNVKMEDEILALGIVYYGFGIPLPIESEENLGIRPVITINKDYVIEDITDTIYTGKVIDYIEFNTDYNLGQYMKEYFDNSDYRIASVIDLNYDGSYVIGMIDLDKYTGGLLKGYALALSKSDFSEGQMIYASETFDLSSQIPWAKADKSGWLIDKLELEEQYRIKIWDLFMEVKDSVILSSGITK